MSRRKEAPENDPQPRRDKIHIASSERAIGDSLLALHISSVSGRLPAFDLEGLPGLCILSKQRLGLFSR